MSKIIIVDKDNEYSIRMLNYISVRDEKIHVYNILPNINDAICLLKKRRIDLILIGIENQVDYENIRNKLIKAKNNSKIIFLYKNKIMIKLNKYNKGEYYCKAENLEELYNLIIRLCLEESIYDDNIKSMVQEELKHLRFNFKYDGTLYLEDAIIYAYKKQNEYNDINIKNDIYPILSRKYKKNINCIKTNIINAINIMYFECPEMILKEYFKYGVVIKPTTKKIIITIANKIKKSPLYNDTKRDKIKRA